MSEEEATGFEIDTIDDLRRVIIMAQGGDPEAQQTLNAFLQFKDNIERTNLPTRRDVQMIAYLDYAGKIYWPDFVDDPFSKAADSLARAFMAKSGDKSKQFVELMKQTPSLSDLQMIEEAQPRSLRERIFGRRGEE